MFYSNLDGFTLERVSSIQVSITDEEWEELVIGQSSGMLISTDVNGRPTLEKPTIDYVAVATSRKNEIIREAMQSINVIQMKMQSGRKLTSDEECVRDRVLDFIDEIESLDLTKAPDITFPEFK
jgi:Caudovirales tail fibre assembly protein.